MKPRISDEGLIEINKLFNDELNLCLIKKIRNNTKNP